MNAFRTVAATTAAAALGLALLAGTDLGSAAYADPQSEEDSGATQVMPSQQAPPEVIDHGVALEAITVTQASRVDTLDDGREIAYLFNRGQPISLSVVDMDTLEVIDRHEFTEHSSGASHVINEEDNMLYFSVSGPPTGALFRYDPYAQEVTELATDIVGEGLLRSMTIVDGVIYGSTYPNAKVFSYDLDTGEIGDYGTVDEDSAYAWGFEEVDGDLWVGTGTNPTLTELDPQTGELTDIELPAAFAEKDFITDISQRGDLVFVRSSPSGDRNLAIYDLEADDWCCTNTELMGDWSVNSHDGTFYYIGPNESGDWEIRGYDVAAREDFSIGWNESNMAGEQAASTSIQLVELDREGYPGATLMGFREDGVLWYYNLENETGELFDVPIQGSALEVQSAAIGPDGEPYFGSYGGSGVMARLHHGNGEIEQLDGPYQADAVATVGDHLVIGTYTGAGFYVGDMDQEWQWETNPEHLFSIGREAGQDRVSDLADADGLAAAATIPNYGELGGALVLFDPADGDADPQVHRNVVQDHSVVSLAHHDGIIYGGTSIHGGIDSDPAEGPAELFIWDVEAQERIDSIVAEEAADIIHTLTFDDEGRLWGMTDSGTMFEFDTETHEVTTSISTGLANSNIWGRTSEMAPNPVDGLIYGNAASRIFTFDPDSQEFTILDSESVRYSAVHEDGTVYFTDRSNIYSFFPEAGTTCDETITGTHQGQLVIESGTTCIEDATLGGGIEVHSHASAVMSDSSLRGPLTATGAEQVQITGSDLRGPVRLEEVTDAIGINDNTIRGPLAVNDSTGAAPVISDNTIRGPLQCQDNAAAPTDDGAANTIHGRAGGQCAGM